jgi:probable HAF family extracellular repeat protein
MKRSAGMICALVFLLVTALSFSPVVAGPKVLFEGGADYIYTPVDINNEGLVVGNAKSVKGNTYFAWAWRPGEPLKVIVQVTGPGYIPPTWQVYDVNESGQVVGWYRYWDEELERVTRTAIVWDEINGPAFLEYPKGMNQCYAKAINDAGQIAGQCCDGLAEEIDWTAFLWDLDGEIVSLGTLGGAWSETVDINASGQVLGRSYREGRYAGSCFLWTPGEGMVDLGDLGSGYCYPLDLNDLGQVTAVSSMGSRGTQGVTWDAMNGLVWIDPGAEGSFYPKHINNNGQVAGVYYGTSYEPAALRWTREGGFLQLTHPGALMKSVGINEAGDVLIEDVTEKNALVWTAGRGAGLLWNPGWMEAAPAVINDNGQAVGSFTRHWNKKADEFGLVMWEVKQ